MDTVVSLDLCPTRSADGKKKLDWTYGKKEEMNIPFNLFPNI